MQPGFHYNCNYLEQVQPTLCQLHQLRLLSKYMHSTVHTVTVCLRLLVYISYSPEHAIMHCQWLPSASGAYMSFSVSLLR